MSSNVYTTNLNNGYSGDSDFEIINSEETELNNCCYQKLNNDKDYWDCSSCNCNSSSGSGGDLNTNNTTLVSSSTDSSHHNNFEPISEFIFDKFKYENQRINKNRKLKLSLSQEQILLVEQHHHQNHKYLQHQNQQKKHNINSKSYQRTEVINNKNESDIINKSRSSPFTIPFTIVPINISKNNENCGKTEKANLPEIVLTSFEHSNSLKSNEKLQKSKTISKPKITIKSNNLTNPSNDSTKSIENDRTNTTIGVSSEIITLSSSPVSEITEGTSSTESSHQIEIHRNQNSPSPEVLLDRVLSNESLLSLCNKTEYDDDKIRSMANGSDEGNTSTTASGGGSGNGSGGDIDINVSNHHLNSISPSFTIINNALNLEGSLEHQIKTIDYLHDSSLPNTNIEHGLDRTILHESKEIAPNELKCRICNQIYKDPRTLNCLHSFCFQCLIDENFSKDASIPFWSRPNHNNFNWTLDDINGIKSTNSYISSSMMDPDCPSTLNNSSSPILASQSSLTSFISRKSSQDKQSKDKSSKSSPKKLSPSQQTTSSNEKVAIIVCTICKFNTEIPVGGIRQLPQNFILIRKIENLLLKIGNDVISNIWCSLCCAEITAAYHCVTCTMNLCSFCKQAHERQKSTSNHNIRHLLELRKSKLKNSPDDQMKLQNIKCPLHPGFDLKGFCITCQQIICSDCTVLLHKGHKCELAHKVFKTYQKTIKETVDKMKPLCEYASHSVSKLNTISSRINKKCDEVHNDVEKFIALYFEALEFHHKTLIEQISRARENKIQIILEQQFEMEKKAAEVKDAVALGEELLESGNEIEILSLVDILLKRLSYCQKFKPLLNPKISDTLHFLPEIRAPMIDAQNNIPLYGIITTQTVEPHFCTLETTGYTQLRVHRRVELVVLSRDADGVPLCHGGLTVYAQLKYKDSSKHIETQVSDRRDGTYIISFTPDSPGTMNLVITIHNKHIKGSPFTLIARTVKPHRGIFHCCTFCSSKGSKTVSCACEGTMPGFNGCGHGHNGHPGRRHWSCCGSILENSECPVINNFKL